MRISATQLESFRLFMDPEQEWMSEESLAATIRGEFKPTHPVLLGQAFGRVLEDPDRFMVPGAYECQGFTFPWDVMEPALAVVDRRSIFEAKAIRNYGPHTVVSKADALLGTRLHEFKTTLSTFDFDKYAASCQWRFMADMFEPSQITYHVFCLFEPAAGGIELRSVESFNLFPYPGLHDDCCELVDRFAHYVTARGLDVFLNARQKASEAA